MIRVATILMLMLIPVGRLQAEVELNAAERQEFLNSLTTSRPPGQIRKIQFSERRTVRVLTRPVESEGTLFFQAPDKFRREVTSKNQGSIMLSDGQDLVLYYPEFAEAEIYPVSRLKPAAEAVRAVSSALDLSNLERNFRSAIYRNDLGYRLKLTPRTSVLRKRLVSVELQLDGRREFHSSVIEFRDGSRSETSYRNEEVLTEAAGRQIFQLNLPPGVKITRPLD